MPVTKLFTIRDYIARDEEHVLALLKLMRTDGPALSGESPFWRWKHFANPFGPSLVMVAAGEGVVGLRVFLRWELLHGDRRLTAVRAVDTLTHPHFRRQGIFQQLNQATLDRARAEGIDLIFNTPNDNILGEDVKMGWSYVGRPQVLVRLRRPVRIAHAFSSDSNRDSNAAMTHVSPPGMHLSDLLADEESITRLASENDALCRAGLRTPRSAEFLRWRYASVPFLDYRAAVLGDDPLDAAIVFRVKARRGLREVMLCETLVSERVRSLRRLISLILQEADADYAVAHARAWSPQWRLLVLAGFVPAFGVGLRFAVHPLTELGRSVGAGRLDKWRLSLGDLEVL